jgi:hypothetical protein
MKREARADQEPQPQELPNVTAEEAQAQLEEIRPQPPPSFAPPRGSQPGEHPLNPLQNDPQALAEFVGGPKKADESKRAFWDRDIANKPVLHRH